MIRASANHYRAFSCLRAVDHFLHDIEITNFKSIRSQKIDGCKRINVFIGYPNVGKSNILEAIGSVGMYHFTTTLGEFSMRDFIRLESGTELFFEGNSNDYCGIKLNDAIELMFFAQKSAGQILSFAKYYSNDGIQKVADLEFNNYFKVDKDSLKKLSKEHKDLRNGFGSGNLLVKKYSFKSNIEHYEEYGGSFRFPYGENLMQVLNGNQLLRKEVSNLFDKYNLKLALDKNSGTIKVVKDYDDGTIFLLPYSLIADTLQRLIFYKAAITSNNDSVLLFEEPEAHMFPPYIKLFTNDIVDKKSNQFFIATHSPFVLNELMEHGRDELSVYTVDLKNGETTIKRLTDEELEEVHQYGVDLFFNLESYL